MDNVLTTQTDELHMLEVRQKAEFALSPIGQMVAQMEAVSKVAEMYSKSDLVPATFKGKPENCAVAVNMAVRMRTDPIMVMQNMYVVHGFPSLSSKMIIAMINSCGEFEPLRWETRDTVDKVAYADPKWGYRAYTYRKSDVEHKFRLESAWITNDMVAKANWGPLWKSMPEQMFRYRTAVFWARVHAPEITMGFMSKEEVEEPSFEMAEAVEVTEQKSLADLARENAAKQSAKPEPPKQEVSTEPAKPNNDVVVNQSQTVVPQTTVETAKPTKSLE